MLTLQHKIGQSIVHRQTQLTVNWVEKTQLKDMFSDLQTQL